MVVDGLHLALLYTRTRRWQAAVDVCSDILSKNPFDQAAWLLKVRALTELSCVDDTELEEEGLAELLLDENATAKVPRPGTSFKKPLTSSGASQGVRPLSKSGRPITGFARPGTQSARPSTVEGAIRTPRTALATARPVTTASGRFVRLGTASMASGVSDVFIDTSKLDLRKYAGRPSLCKALFRYLLHVANDTLKALELAAIATEQSQFQEWWWKTSLGICYYRLGMYRDAEKQFLSSLRSQPMIVTTLLLSKVYIRLDQPQNAIQCYTEGLEKFPTETQFMAGIARVYEGIGDLTVAVQHYKKLLTCDSTNVEGIASLAANCFYSDQPEYALIYYRRLLQVGVSSAELFNNLALCCFYAQQYDMTLGSFERALALAQSNEALADIWYNISIVTMAVGDVGICYQALKLALSYDNTHAEAFNNLGVLEYRKANLDQARAHFQSAIQASPQMHESHYNYAILSFSKGDFQQCFQEATTAKKSFEEHVDSRNLIDQLQRMFHTL
eukprot:m.404376 g.404376  ORF g.404376 m.404376 type:complete len:503 (+) comp56475_c0_seq18:50-1558(+)